MTATRKQIEAERINRQINQTAAERYAELRGDIAVLMDCITAELDEHGKRAAGQPRDWGFVGDMSRFHESMREILKALLIGRYEWTETDAARFVTDHLEAMRETPQR